VSRLATPPIFFAPTTNTAPTVLLIVVSLATLMRLSPNGAAFLDAGRWVFLLSQFVVQRLALSFTHPACERWVGFFWVWMVSMSAVSVRCLKRPNER